MLSLEERDSFGMIVGSAGADASAAVCSELRAAAWTYLENRSDMNGEDDRDTTPWTMVGLKENGGAKLESVSEVCRRLIRLGHDYVWCTNFNFDFDLLRHGPIWRTI